MSQSLIENRATGKMGLKQGLKQALTDGIAGTSIAPRDPKPPRAMDDDTATKDLATRTVLPGGPDITGFDRDTELRRTALDQLAAELSSATIRVDGDRIDDALHDGLARIGEVLDVDRAAVFVYSEDGKSIEHVLDWQRTSAVAAPEGLRRLSWYGDRLLAGDVIVLNCLPDDLPLDARRDWST